MTAQEELCKVEDLYLYICNSVHYSVLTVLSQHLIKCSFISETPIHVTSSIKHQKHFKTKLIPDIISLVMFESLLAFI